MSVKSIQKDTNLTLLNVQKDGVKFDDVLLAGKEKIKSADVPRCEVSVLVVKTGNSKKIIDAKIFSSKLNSKMSVEWKGVPIPAFKGQVILGTSLPDSTKAYGVFRGIVDGSEKITRDQFQGICAENGVARSAKIDDFFNITDRNVD
jgi:hypothetical protein